MKVPYLIVPCPFLRFPFDHCPFLYFSILPPFQFDVLETSLMQMTLNEDTVTDVVDSRLVQSEEEHLGRENANGLEASEVRRIRI